MRDLSKIDVLDLVGLIYEAVATLRGEFTPEAGPAFRATWNEVWDEIGSRLSSDREAFLGFLVGFDAVMEHVQQQVQLRRTAVARAEA